jgi:hypothetical protein
VITRTDAVCWRFKVGIAASRPLDHFADRGGHCFSVNVREEERGRVGSDRDIRGGEELADDERLRALLARSDDAVFHRHWLCVTGR